MSVGRKEVAEAFIDVHGDLSNFRKDLEKANEDMAALARKNADSFTEEWGKRMSAGVDRQWKSVIDGMYSADGFDINRLVKDFNSKDIDEAQEKIGAFLRKMRQHKKFESDEYQAVKKAMNEAFEATRAQADEEERLAKNRITQNQAYKRMVQDINDGLDEQRKKRKADEAAWVRANDAMVQQFKEIRKAYDDSFDGMFKTQQAKRLTEDLKNMVIAMESADWSKFAKGFDSLDDMAARIEEANKALFEQGRITDENRKRIQLASDEFITAKKAEEQAIIDAAVSSKHAKEDENRLSKEALDAARAAREEAERLDRTFESMVAKGMVTKMENDFKRLSDAVARNDWSNIAKGFENFDQMEASVRRVMNTYHELGRVSDVTMSELDGHFIELRQNADRYNISFARANGAAQEHESILNRNNLAMRLLGQGAENMARKVGAMVGFNVITDSLRAGSEFMTNMDRHAVSFMKTFTTGGAAVSGIVGAIGGLSTVIADVGKTAAGIGLFAPGFVAGLGIGMGVLIASFKDMKKVLKDLGPSFTKLQDSISAAFWKQAAQPIRDLTNNMMPLLNDKLKITAENLGGMFKEFARVLDNEETRNQAANMFDRMNSAIKITQGMVAPLTNAFVTLADYGSLYFERFGTWLVDISNQFNDFIQNAAANGDLQRWMEETITGLKNLWAIAGDVVDIFRSINDAATMAGSTGLQGFRDAMDDIAETMRSPRFQAAMTQVFKGAFDALEGLKKGFLDLGPAIESFLPTYSSIMSRMSGIFEKAFGVIGGFLVNKEFQKGLDDFVAGISKAFDNMLPAIQPMATSLGGVFTLMGKILDVGSKLLAEVFIKLGPEFDKVVKAIEPLIAPAGELGSAVITAVQNILKVISEDIMPPLVRLFEELLPVLTGVFNQITPESLEKFKKLGEVIGGVADAVKALKDALGPLQEGGDLEWLGDVLFSGGGPGGKSGESGTGNPISDMILNLVNGIDWAGFGAMIADGWNRLWSGNIFGDQPGKFFTEADTNMNKWWDDTIGSWWDDTIGPWFDGIKGMFEDAWNGFTEFLDGLFGGGRNDGGDKGSAGARSVGSVIGLEDLEDPSKWEEFGASVREGITTFFEGIGTWIDEQSTALKEGWDEFWGGFGDKVEEIWNGFWEFIVEKYTEITTGLTEWWTGLKEGWDGFWDGVKTKVEEVWNGFWEFITTKYTEISTGLTEWWTGLKTGWDGFWDGVRLKVEEIWNGIKDWITTKYTEIKTGIDTWITDVKTNWDNFWNGVKAKAEEIWNGLKSFIDTKVQEIKDGINNKSNEIKTNWDNFWSGVGNTVRDKWNEMVNWVNQKVTEIRTNIDNFINTVRSNWDNFWRGVGQTVQTEWNNLTRTIQTKVDEIVGFVQSLPERIRQFFNVDLSGQGNAIMNSFRRGLEGAWQGVKDFVGGIASWIAENKGPIEYDRKLLTPAGEAIMQGLVGGLENGMPPLTSTLHDITDQLRSSIVSAVAESEMYRAGADAAMGLANGLASKKQTLADTFSDLLPDTAPIGINASGVTVGGEGVGAATPQKVVNFEKESIVVQAPQANGEIVAAKVVDEIVENSSLI